MTIFLSTGPVISTRLSSKSFGSGATCALRERSGRPAEGHSQHNSTRSQARRVRLLLLGNCYRFQGTRDALRPGPRLPAALPHMCRLRQEARLLPSVIPRLHRLAARQQLLQARPVVARQLSQELQRVIGQNCAVAACQHPHRHPAEQSGTGPQRDQAKVRAKIWPSRASSAREVMLSQPAESRALLLTAPFTDTDKSANTFCRSAVYSWAAAVDLETSGAGGCAAVLVLFGCFAGIQPVLSPCSMPRLGFCRCISLRARTQQFV